ncbi:MAG: hypothetical protein WD967_00065, partial [Candidatus Levyibacteriota bacterium]
MSSKFKLAILALLLLAAAGYFYFGKSKQQISLIPSTSSPSKLPPSTDNPRLAETIATGLSVPWALAFLP